MPSKPHDKAKQEDAPNQELTNDMGLQIQKTTMEAVSYTENSSPFPSAEDIEVYERLYPGTMKIFMDKYSEEQVHRHEIEKKESEANIKSMQTEYSLEEEDLKLNFKGNILGQILSTVICLSALCATCYLATQGHTAAAVAVVSIPFAGIIRAIMKK
jgi:uncharacterized membrane protein